MRLTLPRTRRSMPHLTSVSFGAAPFDDEDRDVGTPTSQFVGDASERVHAFLMGRGDERHITRSAVS